MVDLSWIDFGVVVAYLALMLVLGLIGLRRERSDDEYFLVGRHMPWLAAGISVVSSMLSSITYLAEPGEVWKTGTTHALGKLLGIPVAVLLIWYFTIPFLMRFRFTSGYEYLEHRFGLAARRCGATLFITMIMLWMGLAVLVPSQLLARLSGIPLPVVIASVGGIATLYTMLGGLRTVIWTDVIQVSVLAGGAVATIAVVATNTSGTVGDWIAVANSQIADRGPSASVPIFSWDPTVRVTVVTAAINMAVWQLCMHSSNQIPMQRYFSTRSASAARLSFLASSILHIGLSLLLLTVGLSVVYFYESQGRPLDGQLDLERQNDLIFPTFALVHLPRGAGGLLLAALWAAAMSIVDSGLNAMATVAALEIRRSGPNSNGFNHVRLAMLITALGGVLISVAAYGITWLPAQWGLFGVIPRTLNLVTGPLGALFMIGIFLPRVGQSRALFATAGGLLTSIVMGYYRQVGELLRAVDWLTQPLPDLSFTWIVPCSFLTTFSLAVVLGWLDHSQPRRLAGLTWRTRHEALEIRVDDH
jgi:solute:Na+ symporter, SSS family